MLSKLQSLPIFLFILLLLIALSGCGGGSSAKSSGSAAGSSGGSGSGGGSGGRSGSVAVTIAWPGRTRATSLPPSANSVKLTTDVNGGPVVSADRVGEAAYTQTLTLTNVPVGFHDITISAFSMPGGQGSITSVGHAGVSVNSGAVATTETVMSGTVSKVSVMSATLAVGQTVQLAASATDAKGAVLLLGPGAVKFALENSSESLTLTPDGSATGIHDDDVPIVATVDGVSSEPATIAVRMSLPNGVDVLDIAENPFKDNFTAAHYDDAIAVIATQNSIWTETDGWRQAPLVKTRSGSLLQGTITCVSRDGLAIGGAAASTAFTGFTKDLTTFPVPYARATSPAPDNWPSRYAVFPSTVDGVTFFSGTANIIPEEASDHSFHAIQKVGPSASEFTAFKNLTPFFAANGQYAGINDSFRPALSAAVSAGSLIDNVFVGAKEGLPTGLSANADIMVGRAGLPSDPHPFVLDQNGYRELGINGYFVGCTAENHMGGGSGSSAHMFQQGIFLWTQELGALDPTDLLRTLSRQRKWYGSSFPTINLLAVGYTSGTEPGGAIRLLLAVTTSDNKSVLARVQIPRAVLLTLPVVK